MYNCIIIAGPTGVGKTNLSIKLAKKLNAEIISADSSQVYKDMNIGTAKITDDEKQGIKHHLLDVVYPNEEYSVGKYYKSVNEILNKDDKIYILVGGTGLYLSAITDGLTDMPEVDMEKRAYLNDLKLEELLNMLDDETKNNIDINNKVRVIRAIETKGIKHNNIVGNNRKFLKIFLTMNRENLYDNINKRVDIMIKDGLVEEAKYIFDKYGDNIKSIGYKELFSYFKGEISLEQAIQDIKTASRRYAKRQFTWFKNKEYNIYDLDKENIDVIIDKIVGEI